jgi:predicted O-linked N-acetylglucosamine transferase (SPINDLY family)
VLLALRRPAEALESCARALAASPGHPEALNIRGNALCKLNRPEEALASYDRALVAWPEYAGALYNRGNVLQALGRYEESLTDYERALSLKPDYADALNNRGNALMTLRRSLEAAADFEQVLSIDPDYPYVAGKLMHARQRCCDWTAHGQQMARIAADVSAGKRSSMPFEFVVASESPDDQLRCARTWVEDHCSPAATPLSQGERYRHDRIRLAYLSADFHEHATAYLLAELFEHHDRSRFETIAISYGPDGQSPMRTRLQRAFDRFIDVRRNSDNEVATLLRQIEVDIAIDLKGFTGESRPAILASRPAPVQVNYLGYPGTMGADYIDYIIADAFVIPENQKQSYSEKVIYLPDCYAANDSKRRINDRIPTRGEVGLPETGFVFCSFNNSYKIAPNVFDIWMRLLANIEGSVLWLLSTETAAIDNLRREAEARHIRSDRLVFAPHVKLEDHLARHRLADLFLDTLPCNAHTTASDALWAGLPLVTCVGSSFAGRVAGSLLCAIGLQQLITHSLADYEALALRLARDREALASIRATLAKNRETHALFDMNRFRRHIETAYLTMWRRAQAGEPPESFVVNP